MPCNSEQKKPSTANQIEQGEFGVLERFYSKYCFLRRESFRVTRDLITILWYALKNNYTAWKSDSQFRNRFLSIRSYSGVLSTVYLISLLPALRNSRWILWKKELNLTHQMSYILEKSKLVEKQISIFFNHFNQAGYWHNTLTTYFVFFSILNFVCTSECHTEL